MSQSPNIPTGKRGIEYRWKKEWAFIAKYFGMTPEEVRRMDFMQYRALTDLIVEQLEQQNGE